MKPLTRWSALALTAALFVLGAAYGCGDDDDDDNNDDNDDNALTDDDDSGSCTMEELCQQGVACGGWADQDECLDEWDTAIGQCADPDGLLACNCNCINELTDCDALEDCSAACTLANCL